MEALRSRLIRAATLALVFTAGCEHFMENPRKEQEEDLNAPPGKNEIRARITSDIRENRLFRHRLDEGSRTMPEQIRYDDSGIHVRRANDETVLWRFHLRADSPEMVGGVEETVYYDDDEKVYYYHYRGGDPHRDVWFGPIPLRVPRRPAVNHDED